MKEAPGKTAMLKGKHNSVSVTAIAPLLFALLFSASILTANAEEGFNPPLPEAPVTILAPPPPACSLTEELTTSMRYQLMVGSCKITASRLEHELVSGKHNRLRIAGGRF